MTVSVPSRPLVPPIPRAPAHESDVLRWARDVSGALDDVYRVAMVHALSLVASGNLAERPAARGSRRLFFALDAGLAYLDTGTWQVVGSAGPGSIDGVSNPGGDIGLVEADGSVVITPDNVAKTITFRGTPVGTTLRHGPTASRPAANGAQGLWYDTDHFQMSFDTGAAWVVVGRTVAPSIAEGHGIDLVNVFVPGSLDQTIVYRDGPFQEVGWYGAVGNGVADDTSAIQAAIAAVAAKKGGVVFFPPGVYRITSSLVVGNGSAAAGSTVNNIWLRGAAGGGSCDTVAFPLDEAARIVWDGATDGVMLDVVGPIHGVRVSHLVLDCAAKAATGMRVKHAFWSRFEELLARDYRGNAYDVGAYSAATGVAIGANDNVWDHVIAFDPAIAAATGIRLGENTIGTSPYMDPAGNVFYKCTFQGGGSGYGAHLRFTDNLVFLHSNLLGGGGSVYVDTVTDGSGFPGNVVFYNSITMDGITGAGGWTGNDPLMFLPYPTGDGQPVPTYLQNYCAGITGTSRAFGFWPKNAPCKASLIANSASIANTTAETVFSKSYTLPAGALNLAGAVLRVRAHGMYSTTGTPILTLRVKVGATTIASLVCGTASGASAYGWVVEAELITRALGSSGTVEYAGGRGGVGGAAIGVAADAGTVTMNLTTTHAVTITAQWGTANPANTVMMTGVEVDVVYPGETVT